MMRSTRWILGIALALNTYIATPTVAAQEAPRDNIDQLWTEVQQAQDDDLPQTAIERLTVLRQIAANEGKTEEFLAALMTQLSIEKRLGMAGQYDTPLDWEELAAKAKNPILGSLFNYIAAEKYEEYILEDSYRISQRPTVVSEPGKDLDQWPMGLLVGAFRKTTDASLAADTLKEIPSSRFVRLFSVDESLPIDTTIRTSLYDLLAYRAIDRFASLRPLARDAQADIDSRVKEIFDAMIAANDEANHRAAVLCNQLDYIEYLHEANQLDDEAYRQQLMILEQDNKDESFCAEVALSLANSYVREANMGGDNSAECLRRAYDLFVKAIDRYDSYPKLEKLRLALKSITSPRLRCGAERLLTSSERVSVDIHSRNMPLMSVTLYRLDITAAQAADIEDASELQAGAREVASQQISSEVAPYLEAQHAANFEALEPGIYQYVVANNAETEPIHRGGLFFVSDVKAVVRIVDGKHHWWVTDIRTGAPINDAWIDLYERDEDGVWKAGAFLRTDASGLAMTDEQTDWSSYHVWIKKDMNLPLTLRGYQPIYRQPVTEMIRRDRQPLTMLYTDRKHYTQGEEILFKAIYLDPSAAQVEAGETLVVQLKDEAGKVVAEQSFVTNEWGSFSGSFTLDEEVKNGRYMISTSSGSTAVQVETFQRPNLLVSMVEPAHAIRLGDDVSVRLQLRSRTQRPVAGAHVDYSIVRQSVYYSRLHECRFPAHRVAATSAVTDGTGNLAIEFSTALDSETPWEREARYVYFIEGNATDALGETIRFSCHVYVTAQRYRMQVDIPTILNRDQPADATVKVIDSKRNEANVSVSCCITELKDQDSKENVLTRLFSGGKSATPAIYRGDFTAGSTLPHSLIAEVPAGRYLLSLEALSPDGDTLRAEQQVLLFGLQDRRTPVDTALWVVPIPSTAATSIPHAPSSIHHQYKVATDQPTRHMLHELYSSQGELVQVSVMKVGKNGEIVFVPNNAQTAAGYQLLLTTISQEGELITYRDERQAEQPQTKLDVTWSTFRSMLTPGDNERWTLSVTHPDGVPAEAELLVGIYDRTIDFGRTWSWRTLAPTVAPFVTIPSFREPYRNSYMPSPIMLRSVGSNMAMSPKYATTDAAMEESAGGEAALTPDVRSDFSPTALFRTSLATDTAGRADLVFQAPEATSTWRVMALAHDKQAAMGYAEMDVVVDRELLVTPLLPAFAREGDELVIKVGVEYKNMDDKIRFVAEFFDPLTRELIASMPRVEVDRIAMNASGNTVIEVPMSLSGYVGELGCRFVARGLTFADGEEHILIVEPSAVTRISGVTNVFSDKTNTITLPHASAEHSQVVIEATTNPMAYLVRSLPEFTHRTPHTTLDWAHLYVATLMAEAMLERYPDLRQSLATAAAQKPLPHASASSVMQYRWEQTEAQRLAVDLYLNDSLRTQQRDAALAKLIAMQNSDGSWGWFEGRGTNKYITYQIMQAISVLRASLTTEWSQESLAMQRKAISYLDREYEKQYQRTRRIRNYRLKREDLDYLVMRNRFDFPRSRAFGKARANVIYICSRQWKRHTAINKAMMSGLLKGISSNKTLNQIVASAAQYPTPKSMADVTALIYFFEQYPKYAAKRKVLIDYLLEHKRAAVWESPIETMAALDALAHCAPKGKGEPQRVTLSCGGEQLADFTVSPIEVVQMPLELSSVRNASSLKISKEGDAPLWISAVQRAEVPVASLNRATANGLTVERILYREVMTSDGVVRERIETADSLSIGDKLIVQLKLTAPIETSYVLLTDNIPAHLVSKMEYSGAKMAGSTWYYHTQTMTHKEYYFETLPKGNTVVEYELFSAITGSSFAGFSQAQSIYAPEKSASSPAIRMVVE